MSDNATAIESPQLQESYELCARLSGGRIGNQMSITDSLPDEVRPHVQAVLGFTVWVDGIADGHDPDVPDTTDQGRSTDRVRAVEQLAADISAELRAGCSEHPVRRAFVHTVSTWGLDVELVDEWLRNQRADSAAPPEFSTADEQRAYLRGMGGLAFELLAPLVGCRDREGARLMSLLGEIAQFCDVVQDFPDDLVAGRCYLPGEDLGRCGLAFDDLRAGERVAALDELIGIQVERGRDLLQQAAQVVGAASSSCQPFLHAMLVVHELVFQEVARIRSRVLAEGVDPVAVVDAPPGEASPATPAHLAMIMDGNRRWAADRGLSAAEGHRAGGRTVLRMIHAARKLGISQLSVFVFSTENWQRTPEEVATLFAVMTYGIEQGVQWFQKWGVRVRWCGRRDRLERSTASALTLTEVLTAANTCLTLNVFADYGGQDELVTAARALAAEAVAGRVRPEEIGREHLAQHLCASDLPPVDLLVRTSGEQRVSNFLLWHMAYAEFVFDPICWPDFDHQRLRAALDEYAHRNRCFGSDEPVLLPGASETA